MPSSRRIAWLALVLCLAAAEPVSAQRAVWPLRRMHIAPDSTGGIRVRPIVAGILVGGSIGALFGWLLASGACEATVPPCNPGDEALYGALVGAGIGGIVGLIIGLPPKAEDPTRRASLQIVVLSSRLLGRITLSP